MEAIILAGGFGTRLREVVPNLPKPMASVAGKPFLEILLSTLAKKGFTRIILSLGYMAEKISNYFGTTFEGVELIYSCESEPLGTGGGVRLAMNYVLSDCVFIFNGDTFLDLEVSSVEHLWLSNKRPIIVGKLVSDTSRYGRLLTTANLAVGYDEKGKHGPGLINAGCYLIRRYDLDKFTVGKPFSLEKEFLLPAISEAKFDVFVTDGLFIDIGVPEDYRLAQVILNNKC